MKKDEQDELEQRLERYDSAHRKGRLSEAEKGYREILKIKPDWGQALTALGKVFLDQDRPVCTFTELCSRVPGPAWIKNSGIKGDRYQEPVRKSGQRIPYCGGKRLRRVIL